LLIVDEVHSFYNSNNTKNVAEDSFDVDEQLFAVNLLSEMKKRDAEILSGEWKAGWSKFCEGVFEKYQAARKGEFVEAPGDERQMFSHYLDCEAHRDVWQELFKTWNHTNEI